MDTLKENKNLFKRKFFQITKAIEKYDHISYKQSAHQEISKEESKFIDQDVSKCDETTIKYKENSHIEKLKPEPNLNGESTKQDTYKRKNLLAQYLATEKTELIKQECGTLDYRIKEILNQNGSKLSNPIPSEGGQDQYTEQNNSLHTTKMKNSNIDIETKSIPETITTTKRKTKSALIKINTSIDSRLKALKTSWVIQFEKDKILRITPEEFKEDILLERREHRLSISNLPRTASESALVGQLIFIKAKPVYISSNSNSNQCKQATIYFESKEDLRNAAKKTVYYYNTKLEWVSRFSEE
ncbi:hypothetical protein C2G38_2157082 [Gigaspora rosea]|uniref:RRM domain-containing protein n=1 Tax=Gigaspora rosea TaxID=44941 RepID=A0A397W1X1_9GLOM|nr:hypothetical protein C2G38_2157082 [Gigaspora rosea]